MNKRFVLIGVLLLVVLMIPNIRELVESSMTGTMLIQIPLLVVSGFLMAAGVSDWWGIIQHKVNHNGIPGILLAAFVISYWNLPRAIDASLTDPLVEVMKYISLPFLVGVPIYFSWRFLHPISKAFIWSNVISMLFVMSWLYLESPVRLCNNYLVSSQQQVGKLVFVIGILLCIYFLLQIFAGTITSRKNTEC